MRRHLVTDKRRVCSMTAALIGLVLLLSSVAHGQSAHSYLQPVSQKAAVSAPVETPAFSEPADTLVLEFPERHDFPTQATAPIQETSAPGQLLPIPMPYTSRPFDPRVEAEPRIYTFDRSYWIPFAAAVASSFTDWHSTHGGLVRGGREANPVFGANNGRSVRWGANIAATATFLGYTAWLEHRGHRRSARILLYTLTALRAVASIHNYRVRR